MWGLPRAGYGVRSVRTSEVMCPNVLFCHSVKMFCRSVKILSFRWGVHGGLGRVGYGVWGVRMSEVMCVNCQNHLC